MLQTCNVTLQKGKGERPKEVPDRRSGGTLVPPLGLSDTVLDGRVRQSNAMLVFQAFQTFPTRSGPGFNVFFPGFHPEGVASPPLLFLTT